MNHQVYRLWMETIPLRNIIDERIRREASEKEIRNMDNGIYPPLAPRACTHTCKVCKERGLKSDW